MPTDEKSVKILAVGPVTGRFSQAPKFGGILNDETSEVAPSMQSESSAEYVAPKIEEVVSAKELEREVQYAGNSSFKVM